MLILNECGCKSIKILQSSSINGLVDYLLLLFFTADMIIVDKRILIDESNLC